MNAATDCRCIYLKVSCQRKIQKQIEYPVLDLDFQMTVIPCHNFMDAFQP